MQDEEEKKAEEGTPPPQNDTDRTKEEQNNRQAVSPEQQQEARDAAVQKKLILSLAYVFGILFFLPLVCYPGDEEARFHANQSLLLLLATVIGEVVFGVLTLIPAVGIVFSILCGIFGLLILLCCIYAIVCICKGEKGELPVIGRIRLIK